jgi:phage-related baseplate assembly protein
VTEPAASPNSSAIAGSTLLSQVLAALSADTVRPLTDTVSVYAVSEVDYSITANINALLGRRPDVLGGARANRRAALRASERQPGWPRYHHQPARRRPDGRRRL